MTTGRRSEDGICALCPARESAVLGAGAGGYTMVGSGSIMVREAVVVSNGVAAGVAELETAAGGGMNVGKWIIETTAGGKAGRGGTVAEGCGMTAKEDGGGAIVRVGGRAGGRIVVTGGVLTAGAGGGGGGGGDGGGRIGVFGTCDTWGFTTVGAAGGGLGRGTGGVIDG